MDGNVLNCCKTPGLSRSTMDLGHASGFEFSHATCTGCGAHWLSVFCVASSVSGMERVSDEDAGAMLAPQSPEALKKVMKAWADRHL